MTPPVASLSRGAPAMPAYPKTNARTNWSVLTRAPTPSLSFPEWPPFAAFAPPPASTGASRGSLTRTGPPSLTLPRLPTPSPTVHGLPHATVSSNTAATPRRSSRVLYALPRTTCLLPAFVAVFSHSPSYCLSCGPRTPCSRTHIMCQCPRYENLFLLCCISRASAITL